MLQLYKMAYRDLGRNRRRSFFSALALALGLALLLFLAAMVKGEMLGALESNIKLNSGHLQVRAASYDEDKTSLKWEDLIENPQALAAKIAALPPVVAATPRLFASGVISTGEDTAGVRIFGIDPASEANAPYRDGMVSGEYLTADDRQGILVGQYLADKLGLKSGDTVNLLVNTSNGDVDEQPFTIRGTYTTHTPSFDETTIFMPLLKAQSITKTENRASTIFVLLKKKADAAAVSAALPTSQYQVQTWEQLNELVLQFEQLADTYMGIFYLIVLIITATVIINTLIMSVYERTREIGILAAIGMKGRRIMAMFFAESSLLAVAGIVMGLVIGGILVFYATRYGFYIGDLGVSGMTFGDRIYASLTLGDAIRLTIVTFIATLLAALYPALLAARMQPVEALHSGQ
jgi:ABC-type lipoprotein release transport system permease subunit